MIRSNCTVRVDWENFRRNLRFLSARGKDLMPVIKADAYGHGLLRAASELSRAGIDWAAVGTVREAELVRDHGYSGHIVALLSSPLTKEEAILAAGKKLIPLIHSFDCLDAAENAMRMPEAEGLVLEAAIKIDTGMARLGFRLEELEQVIERLAACPSIMPVIQISHLAVADEPDEDAYTQMQFEIFRRAADMLRRQYPGMRCSLGNTAGLLSHAGIPGEICRPGLALYGGNPMYGTSREGDCPELKPVMSVSTRLLSVHPLRRGESLGYGRAYVAESDRLVGWAAVGYADCYRRNPSPEACMCINGVRVPVIGRVAMQMTCVDLTDLPEAPRAGDEVYVLGGPGNAVTMQEIATWWNTIAYEVICQFGKLREDD
ncbi:MAG: alanine racemase [Mailhella sp.]|nr:alanine racemase [Mailhella sp.]